MNVQIADDVNDPDDGSSERVGRMLTRIMFEQFPGQRPVMREVARTLLLFGRVAEQPEGFVPEAMGPDWFTTMTNGLPLEAYVESVLLIAIVAEASEGAFDPDWINRPPLSDLGDVFTPEHIQRTFNEHLVTTVDAFKRANRQRQDSVSAPQKKYAFNPLADTPFVEGIAPMPVAPWVQAVIAKALPPAIYHLALPTLQQGFTRDLGMVFQHYAGRQLNLIDSPRTVLPEVAYGTKRNRRDSCDWFLDLPELLVLIECKARQPNEALRVRANDWLDSIAGSIGKGIRQLDRSNCDIHAISTEHPRIDATKPRIGLVVTLEPFFINQNWFIWDHLERSKFPVGVVSIAELESLVMLDPDELQKELLAAAHAAQRNDAPHEQLLLLNPALEAAEGRENSLLSQTWHSINLLERIDRAAARLRTEHGAEESMG